MDLAIKGKTALITGAGRGLGEAICYTLAREGVTIIAASRSEENLVKVFRKIQPRMNTHASGSLHRVFAVDLLRKAGPQKLIRFITTKCNPPDIVVHNLGGNLDVKNPFSAVEEWRRVFRLNLEVAIELNNYFVPLMQAKRWGRVCHISSIAAIKDRHSVPYSAAKAALNTYVRGLATVVAKDNVVLTSVMPGAIKSKGGIWAERFLRHRRKTEEFLKSRLAIQRFATCEEISDVVAFLCSDLSSFFCGPAIAVDGGTY